MDAISKYRDRKKEWDGNNICCTYSYKYNWGIPNIVSNAQAVKNCKQLAYTVKTSFKMS